MNSTTWTLRKSHSQLQLFGVMETSNTFHYRLSATITSCSDGPPTVSKCLQARSKSILYSELAKASSYLLICSPTLKSTDLSFCADYHLMIGVRQLLTTSYRCLLNPPRVKAQRWVQQVSVIGSWGVKHYGIGKLLTLTWFRCSGQNRMIGKMNAMTYNLF